MDIHKVFDDIGEFGWYQFLITFMLAASMIPACFSNLNVVFIMGVTDYWCHIPELNDLNSTQSDIKNVTIPCEIDENGNYIGYSQCSMYDRNYTDWTEDHVNLYLQQGNIDNASDISCQHGWMYDLNVYGKTATTEWDLVCDKKWWQAASASMFAFGMFAALLIHGTLADLFGRKPVLCISTVMFIISNFATAASPGYIFMTVTRFLSGFFSAPFYGGTFVLIAELIGPRWRGHANAWFGYMWSIAGLLMTGLAYSFKDWRKLQYTLSGIMLIYLFYFMFAASICYYGLTLFSTSLGSSEYLSFALSMLVELPGIIICHIISVYIGRRWPLVCSMLLTGISLFLSLLFEEGSGELIAMVSIGKMFCTLAFNLLYIYTVELYPTTVRSVASSSGNFSSRLGSILAPFISQLGNFGSYIPISLFGICSLSAGLMAIVLPETIGTYLEDSLDSHKSKKEICVHHNQDNKDIITMENDKTTDGYHNPNHCSQNFSTSL